MARILTRPMFRKGGLSQTPRPSYRGGGMPAIRPRYRRGGMSGIMSGITPRRGYADGPTLEQIIAGQKLKSPGTTIYDEDYIKKQYKKLKDKIYTGDISEVDMSYGMQVLPPPSPKEAGVLEFMETQPETAYDVFKKGQIPGSKKDYATLQATQAKEAKEAGMDIGLGDVGKKTNGTGDGTGDGTSGAIANTRSQFEKYFNEYLPVIQEQLAPDSDAASRDKWLALAKFGTGLMGQPGGDLTGAIGKASQKPLEDLSQVSAQERQAKQVPKMLALQAALNRMKGPTSQDRAIDASRIETIAKGFVAEGIQPDVSYILADKLDKLRGDPELAGKFNKKLPAEGKEGTKQLKKLKGKHFFYTDKGELKIFDGDKQEFLTFAEYKALPKDNK